MSQVCEIISKEETKNDNNEAKILVEHIQEQYKKDWTKFPQILMQVVTSNTFLYNKVMEVRPNGQPEII